jgi:hypothetical protein
LDVAEVEGLGVGGRGCVLAWAEEEEEGGASHVSDGPTIGSIGGSSNVQGVDDNGNGDGFNAGGGRVRPCIAFELAKEAEVEVARLIQAWVRGPHSGKALAHCAEGVLHCARSDRVLAGCNASVAVALGKELEEEDGIVDVGEGGVCPEGAAEVGPDGPGAVL